MAPLIIRVSRWRYLVPLLGCGVIIAGSIYASGARGHSWFTTALMVVFGLVGLGSLAMCMESGTRLIVDHTGVWYFPWGTGTLRWTDIREVFVHRLGGEEFICFKVFDREGIDARHNAVERRLNDAARSLGGGDLMVSATKHGIDSSAVVEFARKMMAKAR